MGPRVGLDGCGQSGPHRGSTPDSTARSESLYRLRHPGCFYKFSTALINTEYEPKQPQPVGSAGQTFRLLQARNVTLRLNKGHVVSLKSWRPLTKLHVVTFQ